MALFGELFLSEIVKKPVFDPKGEIVGRFKDIVVVKGEPLPKVHSIVLKKGKQLLQVRWEDINIFNKRVISTFRYADSLKPYERQESDLLAVSDILDKQIVDVNGVKVVRVNDIKLEGYENNAVLVSVDVGIRGLLRRLGIEHGSEKFFKVFTSGLPYNLISWNYIQALKPELRAITLTVPRQMLSDLHPADIAELIGQISREERAHLINDLDIETAAETISELEPERKVEIINQMETGRAAHIIEEMAPNDAVDVLNELPTARAKEILEQIEKDEAEDIQELLGYEEDTAGGMMTNEFIAYPPHLSAREALERLREDAKEVQPVNYVYIVDEQEKLIGAMSLRELILSEPEAKLEDVMVTKLKTVTSDIDEKLVAEKMSKYTLYAMPVVDNEGVLLGIVAIDAIIDRMLSKETKGRR